VVRAIREGRERDRRILALPGLFVAALLWATGYALLFRLRWRALARLPLLSRALRIETGEHRAAPAAPDLPRWLLRLLQRKRRRSRLSA
jgi:hypothetical protein